MIKILGDINFTDGFFDMGFGVGSVLKKGADPFSKLHRSTEDYWVGNFECVCANTTIQKGTHAKQFIISPQYLSHINHLDLYGVANNHVMQHGVDAYKEMLHHISSFGSDFFGSNDKRWHTFKHQEKIISIMGFSQRPENFSKSPLYWSMPEYCEIEEEFKSIAGSDFKIAFLHWGNEFINFPYNDQKQFAHWLVDLGFDLIIGMHPHIMQGYEVYRGKYIFYSLGNSVFNMSWRPTQYSVIVNIDVKGNDFQVGYQYVHLKNYFPEVLEENAVPLEFRFETLNEYLMEIPENEIYYKNVFQGMKQYRKANRCEILKTLHKVSFTDLQSMIFDFIKR